MAYRPPTPMTARTTEPIAYLNMDLEFVKASLVFLDTVGLSNLTGRKLSDVVSVTDVDKVNALRNHLFNEQRGKEPNYLPPILGRVDQAIQRLGLTTEDVLRLRLDHHDYLAFACGTYVRPCALRVGLFKEGSFYFVAILLSLPPRNPYPSPSPRVRDRPVSYHPRTTTATSGFASQAVVAGGVDVRRHRLSEGSLQSHLPTGPLSSSLSISPSVPSYSTSASRPDYFGQSPYQMPRNDAHIQSRPPSTQAFHLPPIRSPTDQRRPSGEPSWQRDERSSRFDIGGLIDKPDGPSRPRY